MTLVLFYGFLQLIGITCPIKFVTGVSCAGCGMTRAWLALLLHGDIRLAWTFHPLFWLVPVAGGFYLFRNHFSEEVQKVLLWGIVAIAMAVYLGRMLNPGDEIVVFHPMDGCFVRAGMWIINTLRLL